jgi:hypothetical protein
MDNCAGPGVNLELCKKVGLEPPVVTPGLSSVF